MMASEIELWGGIECTVNRVGDTFIDQIKMSGHEWRRSDAARFAELGLKALRFPVLWERFAPHNLKDIDWSWAEERLGDAQSLGLKPIVGFVHHGSGPAYTHLLDPEFPAKLAAFAGAFAERFPWVDAFTPVNEPLTTARFSGLYGIWYPHGRSDETFLRALFQECRGIAAAMEAVRRVNPKARLIQTEDMGRIFSTPFLAYQAAFENERRWLSLDMLTGRLRPDHPLWKFCLKHGLKEAELLAFSEAACPPDILGINHYITSNRFLDERLERYPASSHGGNGRHRYADIEAVRVGAENFAGPKSILREVWDRYRIPVAVTEAHMGCTRDEQLRWYAEIWEGAHELKQEGVDIRAVTAWSLLGAYGWDTLVTQPNGRYEPGVFDLRSTLPRPTALAQLLSALGKGHRFDHPVLDGPGWWHRSDRLLYPSVPMLASPRAADLRPQARRSLVRSEKPRLLAITGGHGKLATAFAFVCERRGLPYRIFSREELDVSNEAAVREMLRSMQPWALINAAGSSGVDKAESDPEGCYQSHVVGPRVLAQATADEGLKLLTFSSDLVFDGSELAPYRETNPVAPLSVYGRCKAQAENEVLRANDRALIVRSSAFFGPWDEQNFLTLTLRRLARGEEVKIVESLTLSPTYTPDLVDASLDLLIDGESGIWHLANGGALSWVDFAELGAERFNLNRRLIVPVSAEEMGWKATRPSYSALTSERGQLMPEVDRALDRFRHECRVAVL